MKFDWIIASILCLAGLIVSPGNCLAQQAPIEQPLETALGWASRSGASLLVIAGRDSCVACKALRRQILTDATTRRLLETSIIVYLDCDSEDYRRWVTQHRPVNNSLPQWFLVRADGKELINRTGLPSAAALNFELSEQLKSGGRLISELESVQIGELVARLEEQLNRQQLIPAAQTISTSLSVLRIAVDSYAQPSNDLRRVLKQVQNQLHIEIQQIESDLKSLATLSDSEQPAARQAIQSRLDRLKGIPLIQKSLEPLHQALDELAD